MKTPIKIDELIEVVRKGGVVQTGVDVYNKRGILLIEKDVSIRSVNILLTLKQNGLFDVPIDYKKAGGMWDRNGLLVETRKRASDQVRTNKETALSELKKKVEEVMELKAEAKALHQRAKENIKKVIKEIKRSGGKFDQNIIEGIVDELFIFLTRKGNAFSYLTKEIFTYDEFLYNHSVNVCTLGTAVLLRFCEEFGEMINKQLNQLYRHDTRLSVSENMTSYILYYPEELKEISVGMFLHDIGKVLISEQVLNKKEKITNDELQLLNTHSYELGAKLLEKNGIYNAFISNVVKYHHSALYSAETKTYPTDRLPIEIPPYVKICKLADLYDSMTSKRSYKEAENPVTVVTEIFRKYAGKEDIVLQIILHAFVSIVGIYPSGSVVYLQNGQLAYVVDSVGPICIPITDRYGNAVSRPQDPFDISSIDEGNAGFKIDRRKTPLSPKETSDLLPDYLKAV
ncbi:putative metal dependent phosphohydrolase [uncultured Desulfobacterium sp.]|uniref:Putative metal dependent phosphohydrolase n=1 Tax=uncultured Desulfobacterium sp. TaxID=201089 RepID=A0A445N314_9BACT|nr:putative metal dependent phosphohydrolase [uncultured Desulfobacterium sp.]